MKYHPFINGLRAVAVVPVILFHFSAGVFSGGYAGVDVFFVISGFLITGLLIGMFEKKNFSLLTFYERRARRILPALFLMCLLCLAFCWVYFMPEDFKFFGRSLLGAALFGTNFTFLENVGYFASPALVKPLLHTW
jgi:peptidoglycan/LPS O-acetylase OafA/YrhL